MGHQFVHLASDLIGTGAYVLPVLPDDSLAACERVLPKLGMASKACSEKQLQVLVLLASLCRSHPSTPLTHISCTPFAVAHVGRGRRPATRRHQ